MNMKPVSEIPFGTTNTHPKYHPAIAQQNMKEAARASKSFVTGHAKPNARNKALTARATCELNRSLESNTTLRSVTSYAGYSL